MGKQLVDKLIRFSKETTDGIVSDTSKDYQTPGLLGSDASCHGL